MSVIDESGRKVPSRSRTALTRDEIERTRDRQIAVMRLVRNMTWVQIGAFFRVTEGCCRYRFKMMPAAERQRAVNEALGRLRGGPGAAADPSEDEGDL